MTTTMRQGFFPALHQLPVVRDAPVPVCHDGEALVKVHLASICNLTDTHTIEGLHPPHHLWIDHFTNPPNSFPAPMGHEAAVEVLEVGRGVKGLKPGDRAFTVRASEMFAEYAAIQPGDATLIPDSISWEVAAPLEMLTAVWPVVEECVRPGDRVVILGQGASGLIATQLARLNGAAQLIVVEPHAYRRALGLALGADVALDPAAVDVEQAVVELTGGGAHAVIECVGAPETLGLTVRLLKRKGLSDEGYGGIIGVFGACRQPAPFDFMMLHWKGARLCTAAGSRFGYTGYSRVACVNLVERGLFRFEPLITHKFPMEALPLAFDMIMRHRDRFVKVLVDPWAPLADAAAGPEAYRLFDDARGW
ncbi:MAG: zinc-dependent alcohol dehydrogenase [Anaerolineae bacterium]|jgi:threonine dehydrogenase-like Zn-dependent dehydrogenase